MKIIVLAGGLSPERDVSMASAAKIAKALISKGHEVCIIDLYYGVNLIEDNLIFTSSPEDIKDYTIAENAPEIKAIKESKAEIGPNVIKCCRMADIVYLALHGDIGENGKVQAVLNVNKIKYTGSDYDGCLLSMDKNLSKIMAKCNHIATARWGINTKPDTVNYPLVIKPLNGGSSIGVSIAENEEEYHNALHLAKQYDDTVIVEEKIEGREFSVGILEDKPLPVIEIAPKNGFYDYKNKYQANLTAETCPADLPEDITYIMQETALKIHKILHLKFYSRIDFILSKENRLYFLEANSLPGMTPASLLPQEAAAAGISYGDLCSKIALSALNKQNVCKIQQSEHESV